MWGESVRLGWVRLAVCAVVVGAAAPARAEPLARGEVPPPLRPWIEWALRGVDDVDCPWGGESESPRRQCLFATRLELDFAERAASFSAEWDAAGESWATLPGDQALWPQDVRLDGAPAAVVPRDGRPALRLAPGHHVARGAFAYPALPEGVATPPETALVALRVLGGRVPFPRRDDAGRLWLRERAAEGEAARLDLSVQRRVVDRVPVQVETRIELRVSGRTREVVLGPVLSPEMIPTDIHSSLPARIEPDRKLRVQVRPGTFELRLFARLPGPVASLSPPAAQPPWPGSEVWVFEAVPAGRVVDVEGVPAIDPQQTDLPQEWRSLPAYVMASGAEMKLVERRRGDADPAPDELALERTLWLDFDGRGYTAHDAITGRLSRSWRLEMAEPMQLGRVAIDGVDQLITRLPGATQSGVEVRQGSANLSADSRIEGGLRVLPAAGWAADFASVRGHLLLPPGWRLLHASGVDHPSPTWLQHWTMLEIFLALITALAVAQLHGRVWGGLALIALVLLYPEPGAPHYAWLFLLGADALLRVVPDNWIKRVVRGLGLVAAVALVAISVPFAVGQLRTALYPSLELPGWSRPVPASGTLAAPAALPESPRFEAKARRRGVPAQELEEAAKSLASRESAYTEQLPGALVSTGPGLPAWSWRRVELEWSGPVTRGQTLRLWLVPPWLNLLLGFVRVALLGALALIVLGLHGRILPRAGGAGARGLFAALALLLVGLAAPARAQEFPPQPLLDALKERLTEKPECLPRCVASPRLRLRVAGDALRASVELHAAARAYAQLPGGAKEWAPETVSVDGKPALGLMRDPAGVLWVELAPGVHEVVLEGPLPPRESVSLPLPLRPARVEADVSGWRLSGVQDDGRAAPTLQLVRIERRGGAAPESLEQTEFPPFARVSRALHLGLVWTVETRAALSSGRALVLSLPLLPGESVTSETVQVVDGRVQVSVPPRGVSWTSTLAQAPSLALRAPSGEPWVEEWTLDASPVWHVEVSGIPPVQPGEPAAARRERMYWPWPGERVEIATSRPDPVAGPTLTLDRAALSVAPGLRAYDATLELSLRSSRGDTHTVTLPEGVELLGVAQDGESRPISLVERRVALPVQPGAHSASIHWRAPQGVALLTRTPGVDLGAPAVNAELGLSLSADRWVLLVGGPRLGPAVLFWGLLIVAALLAWGLARTRLTPLGVASWFLLFVGLSQVPIYLALIVAGWLLALGWRRGHAPAEAGLFDLFQIALGAWTLAALACLVFAVQHGLLGLPKMQIAGNGSSAESLRWYQDRSDAALPTAWALSVPLLVYRLAMLAWALWLAAALLRWLRWGWDSFSSGGAWRSSPIRPRRSAAARPPSDAPPA